MRLRLKKKGSVPAPFFVEEFLQLRCHARCDVGECLVHLVDQNQAEIT
jgi:hypothetical protein